MSNFLIPGITINSSYVFAFFKAFNSTVKDEFNAFSDFFSLYEVVAMKDTLSFEN